MWWTNSLCTSANENLSTLAEYDPLTKCKMLAWRKRGNLLDRYVQKKRVNDKISNSKEEKTSICRSDRTAESHGETRRQHLHLQFRSGQLRNDKRVGAHGSLHLRLGGDIGFPERIPENRRVVQTGHPLTIHICAVHFVHKRGT